LEFTGGINTTSRAESVNSLVKRYVDSNSEVNDILRFLIDYERKIILSETFQYENYPLLLLLKCEVAEPIFNKHLIQFSLSHNYFVKVSNDYLEFEIKYHESKEENQKRIVKLRNNQYECSCET